MVTICTSSLTLNNSTFCPHCVFMCFVWISEQTAIISLYSINWLVCITETECVYCAVRTGCKYIIPINFNLSTVKFSKNLYNNTWRKFQLLIYKVTWKSEKFYLIRWKKNSTQQRNVYSCFTSTPHIPAPCDQLLCTALMFINFRPYAIQGVLTPSSVSSSPAVSW